MTKSNYITDVGKAIEKLADALDPQRSKPFRGDILDLLEWAKKDVLEMRSELAAAKAGADTAWAQAHRLALELECLIMDTKDNAIVSKWWDSAFEAIEEYNKLKPGAAEDAEAWAKMRKVGIAEKGTRRHGAEGAREMSDSDYWFNRGFEAGKESLRQQLTAAQEREQTNDTLLEQQGDKLAALNDLVAELRQQLAASQQALCNVYEAWAGSPYKVALIDEIESLRQQLDEALFACKTKDELIEKFRRAVGDHCVPNDCYATGPLTGNEYLDLVQCPACSALAAYEEAMK